MTSNETDSESGPSTLDNRLRALVEHTFDVIALVDSAGRVEYVSPAISRVLGYTPNEFIGLNGFQQIHPEDVEEVQRRFGQVLSQPGASVAIDTRLRHKDGSWRWVESRVTNLLEGPSVRAIVSNFRDVTDRKRAEEEARRSHEELKEKETELRDFIENATVGLHWVGPDGTILWANDAELRLLCYTREEYVGQNITKFHADPPVIADILTRLTAGEELHSYEARLRCKDDSIRHVLISSNVYFEQGEFRHTRCFTRDITGRKLAEDEARRQRELLQVTLASIGDAVITTDARGNVTYLNDAAERLTSWKTREAPGLPLEETFRIVNESSRQPVENPAKRALETGTVVGLANHTILIARDGAETPIDDSAAPIRGDDGDVQGVVLVFHDVSERKRAERRLAAQHATARILAESRTVREAAPRILEAVCTNLGWDLGELWTVDERANRLRCVELWHAPTVDVAEFEAASQGHAFTRGEGLPGKVWESSRPLWVANVTDNADFPRVSNAARVGLHGAFAVPIALEDKTLGVMEFFSRSVREPDEAMLSMMTTIGRQIGQFIERRQAEESCRESEALKEAILASALDCIITIDDTDRVIEWNPAAERTFGYSRSEVIGRKMGELIVPPELRERHYRGMARYLETGEGPVLGKRIEITALRKDGSVFPVELAITPIGLGERKLFTAYLRDIAERKRIEERKRFLAELAAATQPLTDPEEATAVAARLLGEHLGADRCAYAEVEDESVYVITGDHPRGVPSIVGRWPVAAFGTEHHRLMRANEPYVVADADADPRVGPEDLPAYRAASIRAVICVPLHKDGRFTAAMAVHQKTPRGWTPEEVELVRLVVANCWEALERSRVARDLKESEERLRFVLASMPQKVFTTKPNGDVDYFNPQWTEFTGLTFEQIRDWGWTQFIHPDDVDENIRRWKHSLDTGEPFQFEHRFRRVDGVYRWHLTRAHAMRDAKGGVLMWVGSNTDIDDVKRAEAELREARDRLNAALEAGTIGTWNWDVANQRVSGDQNLARMYSLPPKEMAEGVPLSRFLPAIHPDDRRRVEATVRRALESGDRYEADSRLAFPDGTLRWVEGRGRIERDAQGRATSVTGVTLDITELKLAQEELKEADRRKDEFLAMLAHELRNPLSSIGNAATLLKMSQTDEHREWAREVVERQVKHLAHMVDDLLDVSRITRGMVSLKKENLDPASVLDAAVQTARPLIEERKHKLFVSYKPGALRVHADPTRLEQVIVNLLSNAAKYTDNGGEIRLSAEKERGNVIIRVSDTGAGIDSAMLPKMFELFAQGERTLARSEGGLGIGLTLVKTLAEMHGGSVSASSEGPGKGSTFTVTLPAAPAPTTERRADSESAHRGTRPGSRILVVDDNADTARAMGRILKLLGNDVKVVHDGLAAIEAAREHVPDFILLDIGLPGIDGYEVAQRLRQEEYCRDAVMIAITGYGQEEDKRRSKEAGFDHHLTKPIDHNVLITLLSAPPV